MNRISNFSSLLREKKTLLLCIFITLFIQICISIGTVIFEQEYKLLDKTNIKNNKFSYFGVFVLVILLLLTMTLSNLPFMVKQLLFVLFSIFNGLLLSLFIYAIDDPNIIKSALLSTLVNFILFFGLGLLIVFFGYDLGWLGLILFISLISVIVIQIVNLFAKQSSLFNKIVSIVIVILFSLYILYDTNNILLKYRNDGNNCINGALDYYLDIYNLFTSWSSFNSS